MKTNTAPTGGKSLTPGDIIYTIFRHLKKIIFFTVLGFVSGAAVYALWPTYFESGAKLMIRFVTEDRGIIDTEQDTRVVSYGARGTGYIIDAERAIITSLDLAEEVAEQVGPERIIIDPESEPTILGAAGKIVKNLSASQPRGTNMINLSFQHESRQVAQDVLVTLIDLYQKKHLEIHRKSGAFDDFVTRESDQMRLRLQQTEEELVTARKKANIISIQGAKNSISAERAAIRTSILETKTELAEVSTALGQQQEHANAIKNEIERAQEETVETPAPRGSNEAIREYAALSQRLELLRSREQQLSLQFTSENSLLKTTRRQLSEAETQLKDLTAKHPELEAAAIVATGGAGTGVNPVLTNDLRSNQIRLVALKARLAELEGQLTELQIESEKIDDIEITINELERRKALQESKYRSLLESAEKARVQEQLGDGRINNISIIQSPSPAYIASNKRKEISAGVVGGCIVIGFAWALLTDLFLDRSIKRPTEIQRSLNIPLFMSMPDLKDKKFLKSSAKGDRQLIAQSAKARQQDAQKKLPEYKPKSPTLKAAALSKPEDYAAGKNGPDVHAIAPWEEQHALSEHFEALRDKVITYFESKNLTHKPKLIAMTGVGEGSGVTTIASGLAGSLSKIGEGNVLLVDMTLGHETAQQFYKGKNIINLDEVLETSDDAKVDGNLYVVAEGTNGVKLPRIMPQRFNKIMPKLRASDFDYIIFDMPPVSPISSTPRLASFMDVVLMVMESEKTNRDVANQALELLSDSKAHLGGILNKTKSHVPRKLEQDLLSQA